MKTLSDISAPAALVRKVLEADLQGQCVDWIRRRGYWGRKFSSISQRSVPDYLFSQMSAQLGEYGWSHPNGTKIKFATEFKKPGTKLKFSELHGVWSMSTDAQLDEQAAMRLAGWFVFECDNFEKFKATVIAYEKECA